jgi:hypothetical protein
MNLALRLFAGAIDLLQFIFFITLLAFQFMTPVGGGITGAAAGAYFCYNASSGVLEGISTAIACAATGGLVGGVLGAIAGPAGIAIDIAISCTFGVLLILFLWASGRFSLMAVVMGFSSELLPGINAFSPGWSMLVHRCIKNYKQTQGKGAATKSATFDFINGALRGEAPSLARFATRLARRHDEERSELAGAAQSRVASAFSGTTEPTDRIPLQTKNFDGIRRSANTPHEATA